MIRRAGAVDSCRVHRVDPLNSPVPASEAGDNTLSSLPSAQPVFYAAVAFSSGILLGTFLRLNVRGWLVLACVLFAYAAFCFARRARLAFFVALAGLAAIGALQTQLAILQQEPLPELSRFTSDAVTITGHVVRSGLLRESTAFTRGEKPAKAERRQTIDVETESITLNDPAQTVVPITFDVRVNVHTKAMERVDEESPELEAEDGAGNVTRYLYGERVQFAAKLREPRNYGNPGAMDYRGYLLQNGIVALASVREDHVTRLPGFVGTRLGAWRAKARRSRPSPRRHRSFWGLGP